MNEKTPIPKSKQKFLDFFSTLPYEKLAAMYQACSDDSTPSDEGSILPDDTAPDTTIPADEQPSELPIKDSRVQRTIQTVNQSRICPFCGQHTIYKHGVRKGLQRYKCKSCGSVFTPNTNTVLSYSHQDASTWKAVIKDTVYGVSIAETARNLKLNDHTIFNMRHKILLALAQLEEEDPTILGEITELDETYVLESQKGRKLEEDDRNPRKRGGKASKRGLSNEQVCLFAGVQRKGPSYMHCVNYGKPSKGEIKEAFQGHLSDDAMYMTDGLKGYSILKGMASCQVVNAKKEESSFYHINNVNNLHSQFKDRYEQYRGVATKYINRYLALMSKVYKNKEEVVDIIWNAICEMSANSYAFSAKDVKQHALCEPS